MCVCGHVKRLELKSGNKVGGPGGLESLRMRLRFRLELRLEFDYVAVLDWGGLEGKE